MQNIEKWMQDFVYFWKKYEINNVLSLFTQDVKYFESPFENFWSFDEIAQAWEYIKTQKNIIFDYEIFSRENEKYTIDWYLEYTNDAWEKNIWSGLYILKLNSENKCYFFKQVGEKNSF